MTAYYNENDREKAAWLRELIRAGLIAPGDVDERDIRDVVPGDILRGGYTQCHWFAGVGIWSYALRLAGWPDERPAWTVSCPCQPFSEAGRGAGFADERHLWPAWFHIAGQCRPGVVLGEQVASDESKAWIDLVHSDMEALGYAFGPIVFPAAGVGAPHGRHRIYFVAESGDIGRGGGTEDSRCEAGICAGAAVHGGTGLMGDSRQSRLAGRPGERRDDGSERAAVERAGGATGGMAFAAGQRWQRRQGAEGGSQPDGTLAGRAEGHDGSVGIHETRDVRFPGRPGPVNGFWRDADWLRCRDGWWRPARPGSFPLVDGAPARVVRLRGYGDGIVAEAAAEVIRSYMAFRS